MTSEFKMRLIDVAMWLIVGIPVVYLLRDRPGTACIALGLAFLYGCWSYFEGYVRGHRVGAEEFSDAIVAACENRQEAQTQ